MIPFGTKSVTLSMLIDLLTSTCRSTQVKIYTGWSHQLTSDLKRCLLFRKCLRWSSLKAVSVPTSVKEGLRGSTTTSDLVNETRFYRWEENGRKNVWSDMGRGYQWAPVIKPYLSTFGKLKSGHLRSDRCDLDHSDREAIIARAKKFWKSRLSNTHFFNVLVNGSTHLLQEKIGLKCTQFLSLRGKLQENEQLECPILYRYFCLDNCLPRTGTWKKAKRHRRNLNSDWRKKRTGKKRV